MSYMTVLSLALPFGKLKPFLRLLALNLLMLVTLSMLDALHHMATFVPINATTKVMLC
jgi:hypothetical protein